jgi:glycosyltransferase involved in cell wall biosynthesis
MMKASKLDDFGHIPNVIIASSVHPLAWVAGHRLSAKYNAKFIVEVRDLWPLSMYEDFEGLKRTIVFKYFEALERKYYNLADAIVTTAPFAYEYMEEKFNINRNKVHHIPHGLDIDEFDKNADLNEEILDAELNKVLNRNFCVTYTGSLSKSEGLPAFVQAAKYLKDTSDMKLVIVGSGSEEENLSEITDKENLNNVVMIPAQPRDSIPLTLKKSKILFCGLMERKAFKYGISKNKFYDYMAAQKPMIFASSVRASLIDIAECGITIKPDDPKQLAGAIRHLYNNIDTIGKKYGENGRAYVERNHTIKNIADQFLNVIESC